MPGLDAVVALTDDRWFKYLRSIAVAGRLDEVNFWRPLAQTEFKSLSPGEPFFFRLKHPVNCIVGYGFFAHATLLPLPLAWEAFGTRNGDATFEGFRERIAEYRHESPAETMLGERQVACIVLREVRFLREGEWLSWGLDREWSQNIVAYKRYDLSRGPGRSLANLLRNGHPAELVSSFEPVAGDDRSRAESTVFVREGQGSFRVRVLDAYGRRCSVTGERALPALEAAHIQRYLGPASNHVQNGLSLRADLHRLFDAGYMTVTPDYRVEVSQRLRSEFENGEQYYRLHNAPLLVVPDDPASRPSRPALEWHSSQVFR